MSAPPDRPVRRHADHDPSLICRPALGASKLCEVLEPAAPVMLTVGGKRFACERCGANVFSHAGENFACNGCGTLYGSGRQSGRRGDDRG